MDFHSDVGPIIENKLKFFQNIWENGIWIVPFLQQLMFLHFWFFN